MNIRDAARASPDPERAEKNLRAFFEKNGEIARDIKPSILRPIAILFGSSQFLSSYCISSPEVLLDTLCTLKGPKTKSEVLDSITPVEGCPMEDFLRIIREIKKKDLLRITLRDILNKADLIDTVSDLSSLADAIIEASYRRALEAMTERYGDVDGQPANALSIIGLGKLGGEELNYSSDIDIIYVYGSEVGETSGVLSPQGVRINRISNHEYFCKLGELVFKMLSIPTEDGFAYRVDLRLRPEGQRGDIALSLRSYELYYESWGRTWERQALIKARPVAGDMGIAEGFIRMITPFVYRKYLDIAAIDEIGQMKGRIDSTSKRDDIKRGYGGIREVEFFIQAFQLIYGGKEPLLRERNTLRALHRITQKGIIGYEDYQSLSQAYIFLRRLEHRLQFLHDLQTHELPADEREMDALSRKMGFDDRHALLRQLRLHTGRVHSIFDALIEEREGKVKEGQIGSEFPIFFDEEATDDDIKENLRGYGFRDLDRALRNIGLLRREFMSPHTLRGRGLLKRVLPQLFKEIVKGNYGYGNDLALHHLQAFVSSIMNKDAYLNLIAQGGAIIKHLSTVFSESEYLSRIIIARPEFLEAIVETDKRKTLFMLSSELRQMLKWNPSAEAIRIFKALEELRFGLQLFGRGIGPATLFHRLTGIAEVILRECLEIAIRDVMERYGTSKCRMAIIGLGKLGSREMSYGSDLDIIFIHKADDAYPDKVAERLIKMLTAYTREGMAYRVDTRLRPEGSKGTLTSSMDGLRRYYSESAGVWERQALLKARPVAGDTVIAREFMEMRNTVLCQPYINLGPEMRRMRDRIQKELSKELEGYDIKLGPGGIEELEFTVQYLQLMNCHRHVRPIYDSPLLVQDTITGIRRLKDTGVLGASDALFLQDAYIFLRTIECLARLRGEAVLKKDEQFIHSITRFLGYDDKDAFLERLAETRQRIRAVWEDKVV